MKNKPLDWRLRLVIDRGNDYPESDGYDLKNSKPWPLGTFPSEAVAIRARNSMVVISDSRSDRIAAAARRVVTDYAASGRQTNISVAALEQLEASLK